MKLYIVRHAIAVEAGTLGYENDSLRPLTDKGKKKMGEVARGLASLETQLNLILTSPYVRAADTAKILRKELGIRQKAVMETEHLAPTGNDELLITWINEDFPGVENIALVGHEPALGLLISRLVAGTPDLALTLKKGSVCRLLINNLQYGRCATLDWLLAPSQLAKLGK